MWWGQPDESLDFRSMPFKVCNALHEVTARACDSRLKKMGYFAIVTSGRKSFNQHYMVNNWHTHTHCVIVVWGLHRSGWVTCLDRIANDVDWLKRIKVWAGKYQHKPIVWDISGFIFLEFYYIKSTHLHTHIADTASHLWSWQSFIDKRRFGSW